MNKPEYVKVNNKLYKINTDFRAALECDNIKRDKNIGEHERALAIIYTLFGKAGLDCENKDRLLELGIRYISLGDKEKLLKTHSHNKNSLDFNKCKGLISSSFKFDYKYDPYKLEYLHWYDFYNDLENLSSNEFGTCCILNRIINVLNYDTSKIKDSEEKKKIHEAQERLRKQYCYIEEPEITVEQEESAKEFYKLIGIDI